MSRSIPSLGLGLLSSTSVFIPFCGGKIGPCAAGYSFRCCSKSASSLPNLLSQPASEFRPSSSSSPSSEAQSWAVRKGKVVHAGSSFPQFLRQGQGASSAVLNSVTTKVPYLEEGDPENPIKDGRLYVETYGCQMNINDMEIVLAIMKDAGYSVIVEQPDEADIIFINTCAIRDNAEHKVWQRLSYFKHMKKNWAKNITNSSTRPLLPPKVAVLGCMAERLKVKLIEAEKMVDVVCGPDAYRDLPRLLALVDEGQTGINTLLSLEETYADVSPVRLSKSSISAFVSIMRGCNNMCSFCIVPFTRGRERSRPVESIVREVGELWEQGVKEVVLLGQNVNSYNDTTKEVAEDVDVDWLTHRSYRASSEDLSSSLSAGFTSIYKVKDIGLRFSDLLDRLSSEYPGMRFRFTSPHPKDFPDELLFLMRNRPNICKAIHMPAQSGSSTVLERMRRGYTRDAYLALVDRIRTILPDSSLSSDFISGFCGESEDEHAETLSLIEAVGYDMAYMFAYSMREKTHAHRNYVDDVPEPVKQRRLVEVIDTFRRTTGQRYQSQIGTTQLVLIDGPNKRNPSEELIGRSDKGHRVIIPNIRVCDSLSSHIAVARYDSGLVSDNHFRTPSETDFVEDQSMKNVHCSKVILTPGDYVEVKITGTTFASLWGQPLARTGLIEFHRALEMAT